MNGFLQRPALLIAALLSAFAATRADGAGGGGGLNWHIESFDVTLVVRPQGTLEVSERIVADFSREAHHGIYREIPYAYRRAGTSFKLRVEVISVTDEAGRPHPFTTSRSGGHLRLRIGDAHKLVKRPVTYDIRYDVERAMLGFDTHDELYWNVTGTQWPVRIDQASCEVILPEGAVESLDSIRTASYRGPYGSAAAGPPGVLTPQQHLRFDPPRGFPPWSGLTVVVGLPKGHVAAPGKTTRVGWFLLDNSILVVPVLVFVGLWLLWRAFGRDLGRPGSIVVQYEPPAGLTPVEVGTIIDEQVNRGDVTATIIDLAVRGFLKIEAPPLEGADASESAEETRLVRTDKPAKPLKHFEKEILEALFEEGDDVTLESLEATFYPTFGKVRRDVYRELKQAGYFSGNPATRRGVWLGVSA
ncbi:MAG: DUF2207 domain-containing protein, partial [Planctomycetota bacterium]